MNTNFKLIALQLKDPDAIAAKYGFAKCVFGNGAVSEIQTFGSGIGTKPLTAFVTYGVMPPPYLRPPINPSLPLYTGVTLSGIEMDCTIAGILESGFKPVPGVPDWRGFSSYLQAGYQSIETSKGTFKSGNGFIGTSKSYKVAKVFGTEIGLVGLFGSGLDVNLIKGPQWIYSHEEESTYTQAIPASQIVCFIPPDQLAANTNDHFSIYIRETVLALHPSIETWVPVQTVYIKDGSATLHIEGDTYIFDAASQNLSIQGSDHRFALSKNNVTQINANYQIKYGGSIAYPELEIQKRNVTQPLQSLLSCLPIFENSTQVGLAMLEFGNWAQHHTHG